MPRYSPIYILYVEAESIDEEVLDLIMNYYLEKWGVNSLLEKNFGIYAIFKVENYEENPCLKNFIKYGMFHALHKGYQAFQRTQLPIVYDKNCKILYVGMRSKPDLNTLFNNIYKYFEGYYKKYNEKIDDYIIREYDMGDGNLQNIYPIRVIYNKYTETSKASNSSEFLVLGLILGTIALFLVYISTGSSSSLKGNIDFLAIVTIFYATAIIQYFYIERYPVYAKYKKIKLVDSSYESFINKWKEILISCGYEKVKDNVFSNQKTNFYFINERNYFTFDISSNSYIIVDSLEIYNLLKLSEEELEKKNIVALVYKENVLDVLNRSNEKSLRVLYNIVNLYFEKNPDLE